MALPELLAAIAAHVSDEAGDVDGEKVKEVVKALRDDKHELHEKLAPVAQALINVGAGKKKGETQLKEKELQKQIDALTETNEGLSEQLEGMQAKPNEQQAAWDKERDKLVKRAEKAEQERDTERTGRQQDTVEKSRALFLSHLSGRVDDFGKKAVANDFAGRFRPKEGGGVEVLDEDGEVIEPPKGKTAEEVLAEQAFGTVPDTNRLRNLQPGGGVDGKGRTGAPVTVEQIEQEKAASGAYRL